MDDGVLVLEMGAYLVVVSDVGDDRIPVGMVLNVETREIVPMTGQKARSIPSMLSGSGQRVLLIDTGEVTRTPASPLCAIDVQLACLESDQSSLLDPCFDSVECSVDPVEGVRVRKSNSVRVRPENVSGNECYSGVMQE